MFDESVFEFVLLQCGLEPAAAQLAIKDRDIRRCCEVIMVNENFILENGENWVQEFKGQMTQQELGVRIEPYLNGP